MTCVGVLRHDGGGHIEVPLDGWASLPDGALAGAVPGPGGRWDLLLLLPPGRVWRDRATEAHAGAVRVTAGAGFSLGGVGETVRWTWTPGILRLDAGRIAALRCDHCHAPLAPEDQVAVCPGCGARYCERLCAASPSCLRCGAPLATAPDPGRARP